VEYSRQDRPPTIKRAQDTAGAGGAKAPSRAPLGNGNRTGGGALVVVADPVTLRLCHNILDSFGLAVTTVDSGIAAVVAARKNLPDLILVDGQLRDVPGREAIKWLRSAPELKSTPIIVLSANVEDKAAPVQSRSDPVLRNSVSPAALRRMIREVLD
jgi:CheY-like chemotaxis protein